MAVPKIIGAQRDFSFGEVDVALKRADEHPARQKGCRQLSNMRVLNSGAVQDRPGRRALYPVTNGGIRTDRISLVAGTYIDIQFAAGRIKIISSTGVTLANFTTQGNGAALPWASAADIAKIVYAVSGLVVYICFGNAMRPQTITFDGVSTYTIADYVEAVTAGGQKRTPFYRLSPQNVTMQPSAASGNITVKFSSPIVVAGMVGTRIRWAGRQILLGSVIDSSTMNATVIEPLPIAESITLSSSSGRFNIGDLVKGATSGAVGIVTSAPNSQFVTMTAPAPFQIGDAVTGGTSGATGVVTATDSGPHITFAVSLNTGTLFVVGETVTASSGSAVTSSVSGTSLIAQLLAINNTASAFTTETLVGPSGSGTISAANTVAPGAISVWDDEVINAYRGYPASVFVDQFRVGFCNFSAVPGGILWSAINSPKDIFANDASTSSNAIFQIAPDKVQVLYVVPGPESSEFVFCDRKIYYIKIDVSTPLTPSGVSFQVLSGDGAGQVQPRVVQELIFYVNSGLNNIKAVIASGAYYRPFNTKDVSQFHQHLFTQITALACPTANGTFTERYVYAMNSGGGIVVGKYTIADVLQDVPKVGWGPWSGVGTVSWVAALSADVVFTTSYFGATIVEVMDDTLYLDAGLPVNAMPSAFTAPGGRGPLWWIPGQSVFLMDRSTPPTGTDRLARPMGIYQIDVNGFIVPQYNGGENLASPFLLAGQSWTATLEPFTPDAPPGNSAHQRMFKRRISRMAVYVSSSTGFLLARLFSGPLTRTSPALGTIMNSFRVPAYNQDDDPTQLPPLREEATRWRPIGRSYDARVALIKDTPGPLVVHEIGLEASI